MPTNLRELPSPWSDLRETVECGIVAIEPGADAQATGMYGKAFELYYFLGESVIAESFGIPLDEHDSAINCFANKKTPSRVFGVCFCNGSPQ
jgi:hypothetical protein